MRPSQIRRELLGQHAELRTQISHARDAAIGCVSEAQRGALRDALAAVGDLMRRHNLREEELMAEVFPVLDGWAVIRAEVMSEEHVQEHRQLYEALFVTSTTSDARVAAAAANELLDHILDHMAREEQVLLAEDVLTDEELPPDAFGG